MRLHVATSIVVVTTALISSVAGFTLVLPTAQEQCFVHEGSTSLSTVTVHYTVTAEPTPAYGSGNVPETVVTAVVKHPLGNTVPIGKTKSGDSLFHAIKDNSFDLQKNSEHEFTFETSVEGRWLVCITKKSGGHTSMELEITGALNQNFRDPHSTSSDYDAKTMDLRHIMELLRSEVEYLSLRQDRFEVTANSTFNRVIFFTLVNFAAGVGAAAWQIVHLRRFFKEKKVV